MHWDTWNTWAVCLQCGAAIPSVLLCKLKGQRRGFAVRGLCTMAVRAILVDVYHTSDSCSCANKWNSTLSWGHKFLNMLSIKHITLSHLTSLTNYRALVNLLKMPRFCFSMSHVLGSFYRYCSISMTALVPPKSQGLEVYLLLKGEIFIQLYGSKG